MKVKVHVADETAHQGGRASHEGVADLETVAMEASVLTTPEVPNKIFLAPWGEVQTLTGSFLVDEQAASATIAAFQSHGTDLPVDYEHQTLGGAYSSPTGQAPAAGWIKSLSVVTPEQARGRADASSPGLWAEVEWTREAAQKLKDRQYRYLSPVALVRKSDRRIVGLHSVALTNKPAIVGMRPVIGADGKVAPLPESADDSSDRLRQLLALDESATEDIVLVAAADRILMLQRLDSARQAEDRVARAMSAGKLAASQRDWALSLAERDPEEFDRWQQAAPVLVPLGRLNAPADHAGRTNRDARAVEASARTEWHANKGFLEALCSEEAYVARAKREAGL